MTAMTFLDIAHDDPTVIAVQVSGKMTVDSLEPFYDQLDTCAANGEQVRLYVDLQSFDGFELGTIKQKLSHMKTLWQHVDRVAYVLDSRWMSHYIELVDLVTPMTLKAFPHTEAEAAKAWLLNNADE